MMSARQQKKFNKDMLAQRNEAKAAKQAMEDRLSQLENNLDQLAADRIAKISIDAGNMIATAQLKQKYAEQQLADFKGDARAAVAAEIQQLEAELSVTKESLAMAEATNERFAGEIVAKADVISAQVNTIDGLRGLIDDYAAQMTTLKAEDNKSLRKRLETKTKLVADLQTQLSAAQSSNSKLGRTLIQIAQRAGTNPNKLLTDAPVEAVVPSPETIAPSPEPKVEEPPPAS